MRPRTLLAAVLAALMSVSLAPAASGRPLQYPAPIEDGLSVPGPPEVTAASWILYDEASEAVLAASAPDVRRSIASITKIMTGLIAIEEGDLSETVVISQRAADTGEREIGLVADEELTLGALLKAALIHSGNDAATAIAEHIGGSVEGFVAMMNERALELGLLDTSFVNPHGLDAPGHYSTARDMLALAREAMRHEEFRDIVRSRIVVFPQAPDGTRRIGEATNLLLNEYEGASGIKTGFTFEALLTFVATAERQGRRLYAVVLGSDGSRAHFADARALFDHGFDDLGVYGAVAMRTPYVTRWPTLSPGPLELAARFETMTHLAATGLMSSPPESRVSAPEPVPPPVETVVRQPEDDPKTLSDALMFWFDEILGR